MTNCPAETSASRPSWNTPFTPLVPKVTSTKSSLARAIRDGVRNTRWAQESTRVQVADPITDCETEPQKAPRMSDWQSSPTKVSQTMSCQTASRRSGTEELVSSTTATMDLRKAISIVGQSPAQIQCLQAACRPAAKVKKFLTTATYVTRQSLNCCHFLRRNHALNFMLRCTNIRCLGSRRLLERYPRGVMT